LAGCLGEEQVTDNHSQPWFVPACRQAGPQKNKMPRLRIAITMPPRIGTNIRMMMREDMHSALVGSLTHSNDGVINSCIMQQVEHKLFL